MNVLITGAASGIGAAATKIFLEKGHTVYALDRAPIAEREGLFSFVCDVTDEEALEGVFSNLCEREISLDAILLVAGIHRMASLVEGECDTLRRVIDVNLVGAMLTVRTLHPLLSKNGRIVIVTSEVASLDPLPFNGLYSVSKTALDAYAQALRQEVGLLGQTVVTVRPGAIGTPLCSASLVDTERLADTTELYRAQAHRFLSITKRFMGTPIPPERLAPLLYRATVCKHPRLVYHKHRSLGLVLLGALPKRMQCAIIRLLLGRKK
jgi:NAD(P)-dependent dehydrogenase (short-subunit alcohol dehydrogenase family)